MKINPELKAWFIKKNKEHILDGVRQFKKNNWYDGNIQSAMDFYIAKQEYFDHATTMQKSGRNDVVEWFEKFNCPIENRTVEEMMHLMAQLRDGAISYKMLFEEPKHPKK
tara:strand:- start:2211 stop:2540 length:330 start_codon:yes stop_codon:yes gene_type:complete